MADKSTAIIAIKAALDASAAIREGRVLSARNRELVSAALKALQDLLDASSPPERAAILGDLRAVRMIAEDADSITVGGYGVVWGGRDMYGTYFTPQTDLWTGRITQEPLVFYDHGMDSTLKRETLGEVKEQKPDTIGLWISAQLYKHQEYLAAVQKLIADGVLGWSSGAVAHLVEIDKDSGEVRSWPVVEYSLTTTPAEPRTLGVTELKSLAQVVPAVEALIPKAEGEAVAAKGQPFAASPSAGSVTATLPVMPVVITSEQGAIKMAEINVEQIAKDAADAAVKAYQEKLEKEPVAVGAFKTSSVEVKPVEPPAFKSMGEFLRCVVGAATEHKIDPRLLAIRQLGMNEGIPSEGGFLVQQDFASELLQKAYDIGGITRLCKRYPISAGSNGIKINYINETSRVAGSRWGGVTSYWLDEHGTKLPSMPALGQMQLNLKKVIALMYATDELLQDAGALSAIVNDVFPQELNYRVENAIINGLGAGQPLGIMNSPAKITVAKAVGQAAATIVFQNIVAMWARMWARSRSNAVWLISQDAEPQLYSMSMAVGTGGVPVYMPAGGISGQPYGTLFGRPVMPCEYCAAVGTEGDIILADFSEYALIDKGGIKTDSSIHVAFLTDETAFRWVYRVDGQPKWPSALTPANGGATLSPFITLAVRA